MLMSRDRAEACWCLNEGARGCTVEKAARGNAVSATSALPRVRLAPLSTSIARNSTSQRGSGLPCNKFAGALSRRQTG